MSGTEVQREEERRTRTYVTAMAKCTTELTRGYITLTGMRTRETGGPSVGSSGSGRLERPAPMRLEVIDALAEVDAMVDEAVPLARGALRMGLWPEREPVRSLRTARAVTWLGSVLLQLYSVDPATGDHVTDGLCQARTDVAKLIGEGIAPFRSAEPCSACAGTSVWVDPQTWSSRCASCRHERHVDAASHVLTLATTVPG